MLGFSSSHPRALRSMEEKLRKSIWGMCYCEWSALMGSAFVIQVSTRKIGQKNSQLTIIGFACLLTLAANQFTSSLPKFHPPLPKPPQSMLHPFRPMFSYVLTFLQAVLSKKLSTRKKNLEEKMQSSSATLFYSRALPLCLASSSTGS